MQAKAIVLGGLAGGVGDLAFAIAWAAAHGMAPQKLLQVIASGWFGNAAFDGGWNTAAIGFASHFGIALVVAALFSLLAERIPALLERPLVSGIALGVATFLPMRLVVLPLSAFPFPVKMFTLGAGLDLLSHMFLFGTPIAFARRYFAGSSTT
jgi:hypothetical protein